MRLFGPHLQHDPGFGLAGLARRYIVGFPVRRMHLDRERVAHVEEFQEQREAAEASGQCSQQLLRELLEQLAQGLSLERPVGDEAGMVVAVAEQPGLADGAIAGQRGGEQVSQPPAAPQPILVDRFESQWIQWYWIQGMSIQSCLRIDFNSRRRLAVVWG